MLGSLEWLDNGNRVIRPPLFLLLLILVGFALQGIAKKNHWSLIPPQSPTSGQSIDEFIKKKLSQKGLRHSDEGVSGRDHNPFGFTAWLAGAGVNAPFTYGATDEFGWKAEKDVLTLHDFHATILHLLGLDHERLSYYHNGIERRLTDVHGHVVKEVIA